MVDLATAMAAYVAGLFVWAAAAKLRDQRSFGRGMSDLGVGSPDTIPWLIWAVPVGELMGAVLLLIPPLRLIGAFAVTCLLLVFSLVVTRNLLSGNRVPCNWFGASEEAPISALTLARNVGLLAATASFFVLRSDVLSVTDLALSMTAGASGLIVQALLLAAVSNAEAVRRIARTARS